MAAAKACDLAGRLDAPAAGARHAGGLEHRLHARLVAEVVGDAGRDAVDPEALAHLRQRHLEVLEDGDQPVDRPEPLAERGDGAGELIGVEAVVDPPVAGDRRRGRFAGTRSTGSLLTSPTRAPGTALTAPTNRVVASRAYGATNTTFAIAADGSPPDRYVSSSPSCTWCSSSRASRTTRSSSSRALHDVGATVIGIGERPKDWLDGDVAGWLSHYEQVPLRRRRGPPARRRPRAAAAPRDPPAGGHGRGPRDGRGAGARGVRHPRHLGAHGLPLPGQAGDEGRAAPGRHPLRGVDGGPLRRRRPAVRRGGRVPARAQAGGRRRSVRRRTGQRPRRAVRGASPAAASTTVPRSPSRSSSRATRASTTRSASTARWPWSSPRTTTRTCWRRCGRGGSHRSSSPPTASTGSPATTSSRRWAGP